jgi:hypothetical protein
MLGKFADGRAGWLALRAMRAISAILSANSRGFVRSASRTATRFLPDKNYDFKHLSADQAADYLWGRFVSPLQGR